MEAERIARLTEAQKACLRLVLDHVETKEIARRLGITHSAVIERLRLARQGLGLSRSIDAARALFEHEAAHNIRLVDMPSVVEAAAAPPALPSRTDAETEQRSGSNVSVREDRSPYRIDLSDHDVADPRSSLRIPFVGGLRDDLKPWQIICCCVIVGALAIIAFGVSSRSTMS